MLYPVLQDPLRPIVSSLFDRPVGVNIRQMLFGAGEQGGWYDVSDMSTLFQDAAGTTPVTAVEQPVGRILDKSGRGNHATQATTTKRPVLSRLVNLVTNTELWNSLGGTDGYATVTQELSDIPPLPGITSVARVTKTAVRSNWYQYATNQPVGMGAINTRSFFFKPISNCESFGCQTGSTDPFYFVYNLTTKVMSVGVNAASASVTEIGGGWLHCTVTQKAPAATSTQIFVVVAYPTVQADEAVFLSTGYDSRLAIDSHLPYQRVNTATDYDADPAKFPAYLRFDGVDDALQTGNIDFTPTDKMTVWAGVTKLSDAVQSVAVELSNSYSDNNGAFMLSVTSGAGAASAGYISRGTAAVNAIGGNNPAPSSLIITATSNISTPSSALRVNHVVVANNPVTQGTGSFGNHPLYIGARNAGSVHFLNGRLYSLIVRGAQTPLSQIEATELYIKQKMRLP